MLFRSGVIAVQVVLGIATLMAAAPLSLSLLHQGGAIALFLTAGAAAWTAARALPVQESSAMMARPMTSRATSFTRSSPRS